MSRFRVAAAIVAVGAVTSLSLALVSAPSVGSSELKQGHHKVCHGHRATIVGNKRGNDIVGTKHRDVIWAGGGNDRVLGRGGNDLICGGPGRDLVDGNAGNDKVYGGPGKDWCVAWRAAEHRLHHNCEVHVGLPAGTAPPSRIAEKAVPAARASGPKVPTSAGSRRGFVNCGATGACDPGTALCQSAQYGWVGSPSLEYPSAYTRDAGLLAIHVELWTWQPDGSFQMAFGDDWKAYSVGANSWWYLPPDGIDVRLGTRLYRSAGYLVFYFSYSGNGGASWSPIQDAIGQSYRVKSFATGADNTLASGVCNL